MKARIREKIHQARNGLRLPVADCPATPDEQYFTPVEIGRRLKLDKDTVKDLMRNETAGVIKVGNTRITQRYSASAVQRLIRRLERGEDPRYNN